MRSLALSALAIAPMMLLASCAGNPFAKAPPPPTTTLEWRDAVKAVPLPATRKDFAKKFPKVVPVKTGEAFAAFAFAHSSEPQDYEFYTLNDDARLMLQVGYKQKPEVLEDKKAPAVAAAATAAATPEAVALDPLVITMDGVKRLKITPLPEDSIVSAQIVLKKEIRFLGISTQSELAEAKAASTAKPKPKKAVRR
ncbi:MAG: hypothetical protein ACAH88_04405 [Roseimicrobium sp.]